MPAAPKQPGLDRNVRLYPWYAVSFHAYFWMPVFVLYFLQHMPLSSVLRLEAIYYLGVVVLENHYNKLQVEDTRKMISELPSFKHTESSVECSTAPLPFVAQDVARIDPQAASDDAEVHLKQSAHRIASGLLEDMWLVYNASSDAEKMHVASFVIDDFRKSFEVIKLRAHSSVG